MYSDMCKDGFHIHCSDIPFECTCPCHYTMKVCDAFIDPEKKIFPEYSTLYLYCPWCGKKQ